MQHPLLQEILAQLKAELQQVYGDRLKHIVLFGSQARGDAEDGSDIDVLVVLWGHIDATKERYAVSDFTWRLSLQYNTVLTCIFMGEAQFTDPDLPLMWNVRNEGIKL